VYFRIGFHYLTLLVGVLLLMVNLYGLNRDIRVDDFHNEYLLFPNDQPTDFNISYLELIRRDNEDDIEFASRITKVVEKGLAHIHWIVYPEEQFNQLIPIWENYFLYFMGKYSGIPEYERYHFADYRRSLERGIGICGDASMVISQLLDKQGISNKILTFPGHVVVAASFKNGKQYIFDADYGVIIPYALDEFASNSSEIAKLYSDAGYPRRDFLLFEKIYKENYEEWDGVEHFITNKYYFEKIAYWLKWPVPMLMILLAAFMFFNNRARNVKPEHTI
jgi:hypothetical protein